jgi:hypothetical protein
LVDQRRFRRVVVLRYARPWLIDRHRSQLYQGLAFSRSRFGPTFTDALGADPDTRTKSRP